MTVRIYEIFVFSLVERRQHIPVVVAVALLLERG